MRIDTEAAAGLDSGAVQALVEGRHGDPFSILGPHEMGGRMYVRTFQPGADRVEVLAAEGDDVLGRLELVHPAGFFAGPIRERSRYRLRISWGADDQITEDP